MANFKRRKPRIKGGHWHPRTMSGWPAWWDRLFHTRPRRRENTKLAADLKTGRVDADNYVAPLGNNKPHQYYW